MRLKLIACQTLRRELSAAAAACGHEVRTDFLPRALHELGREGMRARLQQAVDGAEGSSCDFVLLGFGLCGNGLAGLQARSVPLIAVKAHDCITLLLGGRQRHRDYFGAHPETCFQSPGWLEGSQDADSYLRRQLGLDLPSPELAARYGEENARYLQERFSGCQKRYRRLAYIETVPDAGGRARARALAREQGWDFETLPGDLGLLERLLSGDWQGQDFLIVPPGRRIKASFDEDIVAAEDRA